MVVQSLSQRIRIVLGNPWKTTLNKCNGLGPLHVIDVDFCVSSSQLMHHAARDNDDTF